MSLVLEAGGWRWGIGAPGREGSVPSPPIASWEVLAKVAFGRTLPRPTAACGLLPAPLAVPSVLCSPPHPSCSSAFPGFLLHQPGLPISLLRGFCRVCPVGPATASAERGAVCVGAAEEPRGTKKGWSSSMSGGQCLGGTSGVCPGIYKGEAGVPYASLRA